MPHVILSGPYGDRRFGRGLLGDMQPLPTTPGPQAIPVSAGATSIPIQQMPPMWQPQGPPANAIQVGNGIALDPAGGNIWMGATKIAIIPAIISAIAVKMILFGGKKAGMAARGVFAKKPPGTVAP